MSSSQRLPVPRGFAEGISEPLAGFWGRLVGYLIDWGILLFPLGLVATLFESLPDSDWTSPGGFWSAIAVIHAYFWVGYARGQTLGMKVVGVRVVTTNGGAVGLRRALIRSAMLLPCNFFFGLGFWFVAFTPRRQGWHDMVAGTYVIVEA